VAEVTERSNWAVPKKLRPCYGGPRVRIPGGNLATSQGHRKGAPSLPDPGGYRLARLR